MLPTPSIKQTPYVKAEPDLAYKEQFASPAVTPVIPLVQPQAPSSTTTDSKNQNGKRLLHKTDVRRKKKQKLAKRPVYTEGCQPAMILNEYYKNLQFTYQSDNTIPNKTTFICNVTIDVNNGESKKFEGVGISKKNAKKECCNQALNCLFAESYRGPQRIIADEPVRQNEPHDLKACNLKRLNELRSRINKLVTPQTIQIKSASQILHELSPKISENGKFVEENCKILDKKFCFQISNIQNESLVNVDLNEPQSLIAAGYGKSKKDSKNEASRNALKQFFNCDINKMVYEANMLMINQLNSQQIKFVLPNNQLA
ncbi:hypothetical protein BpHYR1_006869 [Brachionus plicatilis]|uniref:DRBM domain-containing protein n=1 Tax=Brachionus plicatilis TaxID=10195 RepID=A0A3M7RHZ3_BRAPC|nr:hypothetical protein BpHYR1_006869 [Brachionus plicatilis]